jgi:Arc/MetJ-type ribon-helix-helix transcriptional regulator
MFAPLFCELIFITPSSIFINFHGFHATVSSIMSSIKAMKISISLPDELVHYVDNRVDNRSQLVEKLLQTWRKQQEQQAMVEACLLLDELNDLSNDEDEAWQQAAIIDWEVSG